jgi:hypothetical protein
MASWKVAVRQGAIISLEPILAQDIVKMSKNTLPGLISGGRRKRIKMSAAAQYRRNASECVAITAFFVDPQQRATVLALAEAWTRLAEQAEKNEQVVLSPATDTPPNTDAPD